MVELLKAQLRLCFLKVVLAVSIPLVLLAECVFFRNVTIDEC